MLKHVLLGIIVGLVYFGCSSGPIRPEPVASPSPTPSASSSPSPNPSAPSSPASRFTDPVPLGQKLKIYYAQDPTTLTKGWGHLNVYDQDSRAFPQFRVKVAQAAADAKALYPDAINCGYIALGYSNGGSIRVNPEGVKYTHILSIAQIKEHTEHWLAIPGVNCIFLDMAGEDYAYLIGKGRIYSGNGPREDWVSDSDEQQALAEFRYRQMVVAKYLWTKNVVTVWNAWQPSEFPIRQLHSTDFYLFENAENDKRNGYERWAYWQKNRPTGSRSYAVTLRSSYDRASLEAAAKKYGVSAIQYKTNDKFENED